MMHQSEAPVANKAIILAKMKWLILTCVTSVALFAQKPEVSSKAASRGERVSVVISLVLPKGSDVVGIQWETTFPAQQMSVDENGPEASDAAKAAGKSLTCRRKEEKTGAELSSFTCILIGGQERIGSGPIGSFNFHISPEAQPGAAPVRVRHAEAVTKDLRKISLPEAKGIVTVKR
jgi:hypothetical protein